MRRKLTGRLPSLDKEIHSLLSENQKRLERTTLTELFGRDPDRFSNMHAAGAGLILDYSRALADTDTLSLLLHVADDAELQKKIKALLEGAMVNNTEQRPALHTALRDFSGEAPMQDEVQAVLGKMDEVVHQLLSGEWKGSSGKVITDVVNLGIGGSDLGPKLVVDALRDYQTGDVAVHFVSNIDRSDLDRVLETLSPETTLFIVASKSFSTLETLENAKAAKAWLAEAVKDDAGYARHFLAVTGSVDKAVQFGVDPENIFPLWDWVGGRYSLWSAIGLPIALATGMENFHGLRWGATNMDQHFLNTPFSDNLPVLLALLETWYIQYWGAGSYAVLPYDHNLRYFPAFLQQLEMESNGKSVTVKGKPVKYATAPVIWGGVETNGQHSFHQFLHQGTGLVPVDFILSLSANDECSHAWLVANCLAQANALMTGRDDKDPHKRMPGNRPSNLILLERLSPESLGALIALYEHKVYVMSVLWGINAFDQFGVELGKVVADRIYGRLIGEGEGEEWEFDSSTEALISLYKSANKK